MVDLSVIVPVYNSAALISRCLDSIVTQQSNHGVEIICVDDGSIDDSCVLIQKRRENNIALIKQNHAGPAAARNRGIRAAQGRYIAFLDADDYWLPGFVEQTVGFLEIHKECVAVSTAQRHLTTSGETLSPRYILEPNHQAAPFVLDDFYSFWAAYFHVCTGSLVLRADIARKTGGQREDLRICEDLEYWAMVATYGPFGFIPDVLFVSDGDKVTQTIGWVEKHLPRWQAATSIEKWQERILHTHKELLENPSFIKARGRIARNLAYSIMLSRRYRLARDQIRKYSYSFPNDAMSKVLKWTSLNSITWYIASRLLTYREYHCR